MTLEQVIIGVLFLTLEATAIFAWEFYKVIRQSQPKPLPAPASMARIPATWVHIDNYQAQVYRFRNGHRKTIVATYTRSA